jgi:hypothetical protein
MLVVEFPAEPAFQAISPESVVLAGLLVPVVEAHRNFDLRSRPKPALSTNDLIVALTGYGDSPFPVTRALPPGCFEKQSIQAAKRAIQQVDDFNVHWTVDSLETAIASLRMSLEDFDLTQDPGEALTWQFSYAWK